MLLASCFLLLASCFFRLGMTEDEFEKIMLYRLVHFSRVTLLCKVDSDMLLW